MRKPLTIAMLCLLGVLGLSPAARAHSLSTSYLILDVPEQGAVAVRWDLSVHDLIWTVFIDANYDEVATWQEIQDARQAIGNAVLAQITLARGGAACSLSIDNLALATRAEQNYLSVAMLAACPQPGLLSLGGSLFMTGDASQRVLLSANRHGDKFAGVLSAGEPTWSEPQQVSAWASFARFMGEGVWHVLIGYDHVAFVLLLLLPSVLRPVDGRWQGATGLGPVTRDIVTIVTAFTLAHSTTLALAVTGHSDIAHAARSRLRLPPRSPSPDWSTCCRGCPAGGCHWHLVSDSCMASASRMP